MPWHWRQIGAPCSPRLGPVASPEFFNFLHPPTSTPRGFHLPAGRENCPVEGETSALRPCLGIRRCKCTTNKFPPQHNGGLPRQGDEMRKEDGGRWTKVDGKPVHQLVSKRIPHTWSPALEFSNCNIKRHRGNSDNGLWQAASEGKRRGRKMRA